MAPAQSDASAHRWRARPVLAGALRAVLLAVPLLASTGSLFLVGRLLPAGAGRTWWGLATLLVVAVVVAVAVERGARRLLPIALLLKLSMIFPDRAPSRLKLARSAAARSPRAELLWHGPAAEPTSTTELVLNLVAALGSHDRRTRGHSERVRLLCDMLAEELKLDTDARDRLRWSALLHDVGKMQVSTAILNKPGRLDAREFERIKQHPAAGAALAAPLLPWLGEWGDGILDHHEKYDGSGYPNGKAGTQISQAGRLIGLIDAFETMTAARAYKKAMATKAAREELARCAGTHFDPLMVRAFLAISLPRVLWAMGPLSFVFQLPFLRPLADAGARIGVVAPQAAAGTLATGAAGTAVLVSGGLGVLGGADTGLGEQRQGRTLAALPGTTPQWLHDQLGTTPAPAGAPGRGSAAEPGTAAPGEQPQAERADTPPAPAARPDGPAPTAGAVAGAGALDPAAGSRPDQPAQPTAPAEETGAAEQPQPGPAPEPEPEPVAEPEPEPAEEPETETPTDAPEPAEPLPAPAPPADEPAPPATPQPPVEEPPAVEPAPEPAVEEPPPLVFVVVDPAPAAEPVDTESETPTAGIEPAPAEGGDTVAGTGPAIVSGPASPTSSRDATFTLRAIDGVRWQCQTLGNATGQTSAWTDCPNGTFTITMVKDGQVTLNVRDAAGSGLTDSWSWTIQTTTVSSRSLTGLLLLDDPTGAATPVASPFRAAPEAGLPLMALLMALGLPFAAAARRLRARRP